jgi:hypothetical protein
VNMCLFSISHIRRANNVEATGSPIPPSEKEFDSRETGTRIRALWRVTHLLCCGFPPHSYHLSASLIIRF